MIFLLASLHMNPHVPRKFNLSMDGENSRANATAAMIKTEHQKLAVRKTLRKGQKTLFSRQLFILVTKNLRNSYLKNKNKIITRKNLF